jgi:two-component system sensor histidine kinase and response regulator WspE
MLDLFRSEVESHSELLSNSLLRLERDPSDTSVYDSMMRSAHSIKGAARIVRVKAAVEVAHVMEDCFVAAQRGELQIKPSDFDLLLRSVDLLSRISEATKEGESQLRELSDDVHNCVAQLTCLREGRPHAAPISQPVIAVAERIDSPLHPSASELSKAVAKHQTPCLVIECGSLLDEKDAERLRQLLLRELNPTISEVRFDLSKTLDIDAVGLAFLAAARLHVKQNSSAKLSFSPVSDTMQFVLRVSGITQP